MGRCSTTQEYGVNGCQFTIVMVKMAVKVVMVKVMAAKLVMMMMMIVGADHFTKIHVMVAMLMLLMMLMTMMTFQPEVGCCQSISVWPEILVIIYEIVSMRHIFI